jgi:pyrroloquinoline quinone (PQQ) biosynthesis protein C
VDVRDPLTARPPSASVRLRRKVALAIGPFTEACTALVDHPRVGELWPEYLVTQHQIIRATVPLTVLAAERARTLAGDPVAGDLASYLDEHVDEERGHDDDLLADLDALGVEHEAVLARMPSPAVASLVGCQYYWICHHHPIAFLGYVALMEGYPPTPDLVQTLGERTALPAEAFRTFAEHGELDPGHRDHLDRVLDSLPLTREHETVMAISAAATAALATVAIREVLER